MNVAGVMVRLDHERKICQLEKDVINNDEDEWHAECHHPVKKSKDIQESEANTIEDYSERSL